jgi:chorismate mutase
MDINCTPMARWSGSERTPLLIAGPCAAESEDQVLETANRMSGTRAHYFRAGIWKARTRPNTFEGIGEKALPWLRRAGAEFGLKTATEVAQPHHVELALEHDIDLLWIGARTTVNPFSVQELANALRGTDVPVLIKNPTSPDLALWMGAIERVHGAGVRALGAIHRGFSVGGKSLYRNQPMWDVVIELRRMMPELPIITDPSHISGSRDLIQSISQRAMDFGIDGLMIETHPNPDQAWSDAAQQITPERLNEIIGQLHVRTSGTDDASANRSLEELREAIDQVDQQLLSVLEERSNVVQLIGEWKRAKNVKPFQVARWKALLADRMDRAGAQGLDEEYVKAIFEVIHRESVLRQSQIMDEGESSGT